VKRAIGFAATVALSVAACQTNDDQAALKSSALAPINPIVTTCDTTSPPVPPNVVTPEMANSGLPCTLTFTASKVDLTTLQEAFDFNSWLTFMALSQPVDASNSAADLQTVWQGWSDLFAVMREDGAPPLPFGAVQPPPASCTGAPGAPVMRMISKTPTTPTLSVSGEPLNTGPLIDQNGHYVRYQILINEPMYNYIVRNELYSKAGQQKFTDSIAFPEGRLDTLTTGAVGAIVVKAAWKVMAGSDDPSRFQTTTAYVYTPAEPGVPESCHRSTLGLVGIHIVHKTAGEPQWIWSTFEHVDNAPTLAQASNVTATRKFNFFNPSCSTSKCPYNRQPPQPWNPSVDPFPGEFRSQIVRATSYPTEATGSAALWNRQFRAAVKGTVWENYELITTQWPTDATNPTDPEGAPFPLFAANTTMETYVQGNTPLASSTCMSCHNNATTTTGTRSDFTFVLEKAH